MKKRNLLLFICLMFFTLNACSTTDPVSSDFKVDFEHIVDENNPLQVTYSTAIPSKEEYGDIAVEWDLGDGTKSSEDRVTHIYQKPGDYKVKLSVSSLSEKSQIASETVKTVSVQITIKNLDFSFVQSTGSPVDVTFTALGDIENGDLDYLWDFGNGVTKNEKKVSYSFPNAAVYNVTLTTSVKGTNYHASVEKKIDLNRYITDVLIRHGPQYEDSLATNFQAITTPYLKNIVYIWDFGDGKTDESSIKDNGQIAHHYKNAGIYTVNVAAKMHESDQGQTYYKTIQVGKVVTNIDFTYTQSPENPLQFFVEAASNSDFGETTYEWQYDSGKITTGKRTLITFDKYGTHDVILRVYVRGVEVDETITKTITTTPKPIITGLGFTSELHPNNPLDANFIASATASNEAEIQYKWDFGFGNKGEGIEISHKFQYYSTYNVKVTATTKGAEPVVYSRNILVAPDQLVDFDCVDIAGGNIHNLTYRCTANVSSNAGLVNPTFEWEIRDGTQGFYYRSTAKVFTVKFPVLSLYNVKLKIKDKMIVGDRTYSKDLAVLTTPLLYSRSWVEKCSAIWSGDRSIHSYIDNLWETNRINRKNVNISVFIEDTAYYKSSHGNHSPAQDKYWIQLRNPGDKKNPWRVGVDTDVTITYKINGFPPISKKHNVYFAGGTVHDCQ